MDELYLEKLRRFTWADFKKHLEDSVPFEALSPMGTTLLRVKSYEPCVALGVHAGHRVREEFLSKMAIEESERLQEEDHAVERIIEDFPVQVIGLDSRYEYDLNRPKDQSVYLKPFQSWGKKVWMHPPSKEELDISYQKYEEFYEILDYLVEQFAARFGKVLVLDVHSYNFRRQTYIGREKTLPLFNLAASPQDQVKFRKILDGVARSLATLQLPGVATTVKENDIFKKDGAVATAIEKKYPQTLVLPLEIKKIYMDERTGELNAEAVQTLRRAVFAAGREAAAAFAGA